MANSLIKGKTYIPAIAGRPFIAPRPARDVWEKRTVCGYKMVVNHLVPGHYQFVTDPRTGQTTAHYVPDKLPPGSGVITSESYYAYTCWEETILVRYPAERGQEGIASVPGRWDYHLGWDAGAHSIASAQGDVSATFRGAPSSVGAICGLSGHTGAQVYNGLQVRFGFYLSRGYARVIEGGQNRNGARAFTALTQFEVLRKGGIVSYLMDGIEIYRSTDTASGDSTMLLQASLYAGDDEIFDPVLRSLTPEFPVDPELEITGTLSLRIPLVRTAARDGAGALLNLALPAQTTTFMSGAITAPAFSLLSLTLPAPLTAGYVLVGISGQLDMQLPTPSMIVSERLFGRLALKLPPLFAFARAWPADELPFGNSRLTLKGNSAFHAVARLPTRPMTLNVSGSMAAYKEAALGDVTIAGSLMLGGNMAARGVVTLPLKPMRAVLGGSMTVLSGLNEVFCMRQSGGTTQYDSYEFNSFMSISDKCYGANENGLFLLEGADDAGQPIAARFGFGQLDFGSPQIKTASYCYLGAAAGAMSLNIAALLGGQPADYDYPARGHGESMRELRFDLGRGLRSTYLTPTFSNVDGAPFTVDAVRFVINESTRRI